MMSDGLMSLHQYRRFRDQFALDEYARQLPGLETRQAEYQAFIDKIDAALKLERRRPEPNRARLEYLLDKRIEAYRAIAPISSTIRNIRQDKPVRQARLERMK